MKVEPLGESTLLLRELPLPAPVVARQLEGVAGVVEAWASFDTVAVVLENSIDPRRFHFEPTPSLSTPPRRLYTIPVVYDGEDLAEVAKRCGITTEEVVRLHAQEFECRAVGFCPGFAYLAPLAAELASLPRRDAPRPRVAPGSVAFAAGMTAVYPLERPGGWWLIGRTPLALVDEASNYFPIRAGDRVRFVAIGEAEFERRKGERLP